MPVAPERKSQPVAEPAGKPKETRPASSLTSQRPDPPATEAPESKQAQEMRREAEGRLHAILDNMTEGVITSDLDGRLLYWNRAALEMHGFADSAELLRHYSKFTALYELSTLDGLSAFADAVRA